MTETVYFSPFLPYEDCREAAHYHIYNIIYNINVPLLVTKYAQYKIKKKTEKTEQVASTIPMSSFGNYVIEKKRGIQEIKLAMIFPHTPSLLQLRPRSHLTLTPIRDIRITLEILHHDHLQKLISASDDLDGCYIPSTR